MDFAKERAGETEVLTLSVVELRVDKNEDFCWKAVDACLC